MNRRLGNPFDFSEGTSKVFLNSEEGGVNVGNMKKLDLGMSMNQFVSSLFSKPKIDEH